MDQHHALRMLAVGRIGVGAALVIVPRVAGRGWFGDVVDSPGAKVAIRALGIRDLALGLGTYRALETDTDAESWVNLGIACDAVDAAATALALRDLPTMGAMRAIAVAASAVATGVAGRAALAR